MKVLRALRHLWISGLLLTFVASCEAPNNKSDDFLRDLDQAIEAIEAEPGLCEICDAPSDSKEDRRTLSLDGQLIEFCCEGCAEQFYSDPNWRQYEKK